MAQSAYEVFYKLCVLRLLERECDGDVDKVMVWWELAHNDERFSRLLDERRRHSQYRRIRRQLRRAQVQTLIQNIAAKRLAAKVVP